MFNVRDGLWQLLSVFFALIATFVQIKLSTVFLSNYELGILALASTALFISIVLVDFGVGNFIIHKRELSRKEISGLWGLSILTSCMVAIVLGVIGWVISYIYQQPIVFELTLVSLLSIILTGLNVVPYHLMLTSEKHAVVAVSDIIWKITFTVTIYILYAQGAGLYSLPLAQIFGLLFKQIYLSYSTYQYSLTPQLRQVLYLSVVKNALPYGLSQIGAQLLNALCLKLDEFFVGKFISLEALGLYSILKQILMASLGLMSVPIRKLFMPIFSKQKDQIENFYNAYNFYLIVLYVCLAIPVIFPAFVLNILTDFEEGYAAFSILSLAWLLRTSSGNIQCAYMVALGKPKQEFWWNTILLLVSLIFMVLVYPKLSTITQLAWVNLVMSIILLISSFIFFKFIYKRKIQLMLINLLMVCLLATIGYLMYEQAVLAMTLLVSTYIIAAMLSFKLFKNNTIV